MQLSALKPLIVLQRHVVVIFLRRVCDVTVFDEKLVRWNMLHPELCLNTVSELDAWIFKDCNKCLIKVFRIRQERETCDKEWEGMRERHTVNSVFFPTTCTMNRFYHLALSVKCFYEKIFWKQTVFRPVSMRQADIARVFSTYSTCPRVES